MLKIIRTAIPCLLALFLFSACTAAETDTLTEAPIIASSTPTQSPSATPTSTPTPVPPSPTPEFTATPPIPLEFSQFPPQVALQGEPFYAMDAYQFLIEPGIPATEMIWKASTGEHITARVVDGILSATALQLDWYGTEKLQVEVCDSIGRCVIQDIDYTVLNAATFDNVKVMYIGNSGFMVMVGDKKVLIDAFLDGFGGGYVLPGYVQDALENARPPFDGVDVILVTHDHADHFSSSMVKRYMEANQDVVLASTTQVTRQLANFSERIITLDPTTGLPLEMDVNGIQARAYYLSHGVPSRETETYNNAYVVDINGVKFFHTGDPNAFRDISQFDLAEQNINLAFIPHFFMFNNAYMNIINQDIQADYLLPIHYEYTIPPFSADQVLFHYPEAVIFTIELETWVMPKGVD